MEVFFPPLSAPQRRRNIFFIHGGFLATYNKPPGGLIYPERDYFFYTRGIFFLRPHKKKEGPQK